MFGLGRKTNLFFLNTWANLLYSLSVFESLRELEAEGIKGGSQSVNPEKLLMPIYWSF